MIEAAHTMKMKTDLIGSPLRRWYILAPKYQRSPELTLIPNSFDGDVVFVNR